MKRNKYQRFVILLIFMSGLGACSSSEVIRDKHPGPASVCSGESRLGDLVLKKTCSEWNIVSRRHKPFFDPEGHAVYSAGGETDLNSEDFDMRDHFEDFRESRDDGSVISYEIRGKNGIMRNGRIIMPNANGEVAIGDPYYSLNDKDLKVRFSRGANSSSNLHLINMQITTKTVNLSSFDGGVENSKVNMVLLNISGAAGHLLRNKFLIRTGTAYNFSALVVASKKTGLLDMYQSHEEFASVDAAVYVHYADGTVIDGNAFTASAQKDGMYAIVLHHSKNVRITNNTFNGFKVPILMDQYSSIVDDSGNVVHPQVFAGADARFGEDGSIVHGEAAKKHWWNIFH